MIFIICLMIISFLLGFLTAYSYYNPIIKVKEKIIKDYQNCIKLHNAREVMLVYFKKYFTNYIKNAKEDVFVATTKIKSEQDKFLCYSYYKFLLGILEEIKKFDQDERKVNEK